MVTAPRPDRRRRTATWLPVVTVLAVLAGAAVGWRLDLDDRWAPPAPPAGPRPAAVPPPGGLDLPVASAAPPVAPPVAAGVADPAKVRRAVAPYARDRRLGRHVRVLVASPDGRTLADLGSGAITPASTVKVLTATAALAALGPDHRFTTEVRSAPGSGALTLVGGGDPFLASAPQPSDTYPDRADLRTLASRTAAALPPAARVALAYDDGLFRGPAVNPAWKPTYLPDEVSPTSPLWVEQGQGVRDAAAAAATVFARALRAEGVRVTGTPTRRSAPPGTPTLAAVQSAPLDEVAQRMLDVSDNNAAEVLARHVALAEGEEPSFAGATRAIAKVLTRLGVRTPGLALYDGSGLSRANRVAPVTLADTLRIASTPDRADLRGVVSGLPVAGFTGSLTFRFDAGDPAAPGLVRAKTGTLLGVHALAGVTTDLDGNVLYVVAAADRVRPRFNWEAQERLDRLVAALAGCRCGTA